MDNNNTATAQVEIIGIDVSLRDSKGAWREVFLFDWSSKYVCTVQTLLVSELNDSYVWL
jgi:hypothetical protein